ncbi:MAG: DUF58 domain-containing protein [Salinisphaera sp.]|nr:DUF58 domain-containing protein [Salinisphaera sp.]
MIVQRLRRWLAHRGPRGAGPLALRRRWLYILPSRGGAYFSLLLLVLLLTAINYNNNLAFALVFLLAAVGLVAMHHCHDNLLHLQVRSLPTNSVFAGETLHFPVELTNPAASQRFSVRIDYRGMAAPPPVVDIPAHGVAVVYLPLPARHRGPAQLPQLRVYSDYPMNLFRAWSWLGLQAEAVVYPRPAGKRPLPPPPSGQTDSRGKAPSTGEDFAGLRRYAPGDPLRLVHWKAYARSGALLVKQFAGPRANELWLDWATLAGLAQETRLSQLARWVLDAERAGCSYGLRLPDQACQPAAGGRHYRRCLRALALFRDNDDD